MERNKGSTSYFFQRHNNNCILYYLLPKIPSVFLFLLASTEFLTHVGIYFTVSRVPSVEWNTSLILL